MKNKLMGNLFKYSAWDVLCVLTIPAHIAIYLILAAYYFSIPLTFLLVLPFFCLLLSLQNGGANHNHYHNPVFKRAWANIALSIGYSVASGRPKTPFNISHGLHHSEDGPYNHKKVRDILGWTYPVSILKNFILQYLNAFCLEYLIYWWITENYSAEKIIKKYHFAGKVLVTLKNKPDLFRVAKMEIIAVIIWNIILCLVSYKFFLFCYIPSQFLAGYMRQLDNFVQHYGSPDPDDPKRDSVSCYGWLYNIWTFNLGYHQEHHYRCAVHWRKLPKVRLELPNDRRIVPLIHYINLPLFFPYKPSGQNPAPKI